MEKNSETRKGPGLDWVSIHLYLSLFFSTTDRFKLLSVDTYLGWMPLKTFRPGFRDNQPPQLILAFKTDLIHFTTVRKIRIWRHHLTSRVADTLSFWKNLSHWWPLVHLQAKDIKSTFYFSWDGFHSFTRHFSLWDILIVSVSLSAPQTLAAALHESSNVRLGWRTHTLPMACP